MSFKKLLAWINNVMTSFARVFAPTNDVYPNVGVQPFEGKPKKRSRWFG